MAVAPQKERHWFTRRRAILAIVIGILLMVGGLLLLLPRKPAPPAARIIDPSAFPSGASADVGMRVKEQELGISLPVVEGDGWTVPLFKAAHYPGMKLPGQGGRSMLYAHAQSGMFGPLLAPGAKIGDHVEVDRQGQSALKFVVNQVFPKWSPSDLLWVQPGDHEQLVLLTCTTYNAND
ncbi:MAG: sortase, partial [Candidatus Dormibacteraeota bacterium]|nr:sortase [Candidatus Dormibacteraeota bacterium]